MYIRWTGEPQSANNRNFDHFFRWLVVVEPISFHFIFFGLLVVPRQQSGEGEEKKMYEKENFHFQSISSKKRNNFLLNVGCVVVGCFPCWRAMAREREKDIRYSSRVRFHRGSRSRVAAAAAAYDREARRCHWHDGQVSETGKAKRFVKLFFPSFYQLIAEREALTLSTTRRTLEKERGSVAGNTSGEWLFLTFARVTFFRDRLCVNIIIIVSYLVYYMS